MIASPWIIRVLFYQSEQISLLSKSNFVHWKEEQYFKFLCLSPLALQNFNASEYNICCVDRNSGEVACHPKSTWKSGEVSISGLIFKVMGYQQPSHCLIHGCSLNTNPAKICNASYYSWCFPWPDAFCCQDLLPGHSCGVQHCLHIPMPSGPWAPPSCAIGACA